MANPAFLPSFAGVEAEHSANWVWNGTVWVPMLGAADGSLVVGLSAGSALLGKVGIDQTTPGTTDSVTVKSVGAGSALMGKVGIDQTTPGTTNGVTEVPATSGGLSVSYAQLANSNNATSVKASAGQVYFVRAFNNSTTIAYLKLYNKASAPTPASDPVVDKFMIPASGGVIHSIPLGIPFSTGIAYAVVTGIGDTDNTSVAANAYSVSIGYK